MFWTEFLRSLADRGLRANVINPGPIDTGWMDDRIIQQAQAAGKNLRDFTAEYIQATSRVGRDLETVPA